MDNNKSVKNFTVDLEEDPGQRLEQLYEEALNSIEKQQKVATLRDESLPVTPIAPTTNDVGAAESEKMAPIEDTPPAQKESKSNPSVESRTAEPQVQESPAPDGRAEKPKPALSKSENAKELHKKLLKKIQQNQKINVAKEKLIQKFKEDRSKASYDLTEQQFLHEISREKPTDNQYDSLLQEYNLLKEKHTRLLADFENYKKRIVKERQEIQKFGFDGLLKKFLPVIDNFERALDHSQQNKDLDSFYRGVELIYNQLIEMLKSLSVSSFESKGQEFDPSKHEVMLVVEHSEIAPNTIVEEMRKGYFYNDRLLRPALVSVSQRQGPQAPKPKETP